MREVRCDPVKIISWCGDLVKPHSVKVHCDLEKITSLCGEPIKPYDVNVHCDPQNNKFDVVSLENHTIILWGDIVDIPTDVEWWM